MRTKQLANLRWLPITLLIMAAPLTTHATDKDGRFSVKGVGMATCEDYLKEREQGSNYYFMFGGWLDGYLSAINQAAPETYDVVAWQVTDLLAALIENHCKDNPEQRFFAVVQAMVGRMIEDRLKSHSPPVEAKAGEKTVRVYKEVMERAQKALKNKGYYSSTVDGAYGPNTQKAFEEFQKKEGLEVTGLPDQLTLLRLLQPFGAIEEPKARKSN